MIIDCPRCGFAQPKDRYCANCGLDIDHFKPVPEPKLKALAQNTFMQIALVVIVVVLLASGIYTAQQKAIQKQLAASPADVAAAEPVPTSSSNVPAAAEIPPTASSNPQTGAARTARAIRPAKLTGAVGASAEDEVAKENAALGGDTPVEVQTGVGTAAGGGAPGTAPKSLSVYFLEMPRSAIEQIMAENQVLNEYEGTRSIMIASQPGPSALGMNKALPGGGSRKLEANKKVEMNFMSQLPSGEMTGLNIEVGHVYHNDQEVDLEIIGQVAVRGALDENITRRGINGKYTIPKNATLLIVGMVPAQQIRSEDQAYFARTPLSIMASTEFQSTQSQFVVLIQPK